MHTYMLKHGAFSSILLCLDLQFVMHILVFRPVGAKWGGKYCNYDLWSLTLMAKDSSCKSHVSPDSRDCSPWTTGKRQTSTVIGFRGKIFLFHVTTNPYGHLWAYYLVRDMNQISCFTSDALSDTYLWFYCFFISVKE